jgi:hypothetical protein
MLRHAIALSCLAALFVLSGSAGLFSGTSSDPGSSRPASSASTLSGPVVSYNGNLYSNTTGPSTTADIGSTLTVQYRLSVPGYTGGAAQIRVPSAVTAFATTGNTLRVYILAANLSVAPNGSVPGAPNGTVRLSAATGFVAGQNATLSTQGFALMATWAFGAFTVQTQWRWSITSANGLVTSGPWSTGISITPATMTWVARNPPSTVPIGGSYYLCLGGPIAGRVFSVHLTTVSPFQTFSGAAATVPSSYGGVYCWNTSMPAGVSPQLTYLHIWEYASATYLLFQIPVTLVNASNGNGPGSGPFDLGSPLSYAIVGGGAAFVVLLAVWVHVTGRRFRVASPSRIPYLGRRLSGRRPAPPNAPPAPPSGADARFRS